MTHTMIGRADRAAPMAAAPMRYQDDGCPAWDKMWDNFCALASEGGPAHRPDRLEPDRLALPGDEEWAMVAREIARGVTLVTGLPAHPFNHGWVDVSCKSSVQASWLAREARLEGIASVAVGARWSLPAARGWRIEQEIKSVMTVAAKTHHYWTTHLGIAVTSDAQQTQGALMQEAIATIFGSASIARPRGSLDAGER